MNLTSKIQEKTEAEPSVIGAMPCTDGLQHAHLVSRRIIVDSANERAENGGMS
jgi:hypothetical protein